MFDYEIEYKRCKKNTKADTFSRVEIHTKEVQELTRIVQYVQELNKELEATMQYGQEHGTDNESIAGNATEPPQIEDVTNVQPNSNRNGTNKSAENKSTTEQLIIQVIKTLF